MFIEFFAIQFILFLICVFCGYKYNKTRNKIYLGLFIFSFTLIEGLRFGRGIDYNVYYQVYVSHQNGTYENGKALIFDYLCEFLVFLNLPYQSIIIICSGILAVSAIIWLEKYPKVIFYSLPWFYLVALPTTENLFRWYTAFAFVLIGMDYLIRGKTKLYFIFSIIGIGFHTFIILPVILFYLLNKAKSIIFKPIWAIGLYIIISIAWSSDFMLNLMPMANLILSQLPAYQGYADNLSQWLNGSYHGLAGELSIFRQILNLILFSYLIVVGRKAMGQDKNILLYYNIMVIGIISYPAFRPIELADRFNQLFIFFQCIIGAYCLFYTFSNTIAKKKYLLITLFVIAILSQDLYKYLMPDNKYYTYYIWNSGKWNSFPTEYLDDY